MDDNTLILIALSVIIMGKVAFAIFKIQGSIKDMTKELKDNNSENINSINNEIKELKTKIEEAQVSNKKQIEDSLETIKNIITKNNNLVMNKISDSEKELASNVSTTQKLISDESKALNDNLSKSISSIQEEYTSLVSNYEKLSLTHDKHATNITTKLENNYSNMLSLVNNLRLDNLINISNEISKYKEGIYEDDNFLQEVGHCKIIKLTDKKSGEITDVFYNEEGEKSHTETRLDNVLKYTMNYENGKLRNGIEFNQNGDTSFEYIYDDAEEISKKIEYIYDDNSNLTDKKEIKY